MFYWYMKSCHFCHNYMSPPKKSSAWVCILLNEQHSQVLVLTFNFDRHKHNKISLLCPRLWQRVINAWKVIKFGADVTVEIDAISSLLLSRSGQSTLTLFFMNNERSNTARSRKKSCVGRSSYKNICVRTFTSSLPLGELWFLVFIQSELS